jgi:hypothetical protein
VQHCFCEAVAHRRTADEQAAAQQQAGADRFRAPERIATLWRLVWQQWRQSAWMLLVLGALTVPLAMIAAQMWISARVGQFSHWLPPGLFAVYAGITLALGSVPLMGSCTFLADQQGHSFRCTGPRTPESRWLAMG